VSRFDRLGAKIPRCGARTRTGERCSESPAPHPRRADYYVPSGRCRLHGGASTGPRTAAGKAVISAAARHMWSRAFEEEGKVIPSETLRARLSAFLDAWTWELAIRATGLSRRTLLRIERAATGSRAVATKVRGPRGGGRGCGTTVRARSATGAESRRGVAGKLRQAGSEGRRVGNCGEIQRSLCDSVRAARPNSGRARNLKARSPH
jgi:hypothetical protein